LVLEARPRTGWSSAAEPLPAPVETRSASFNSTRANWDRLLVMFLGWSFELEFAFGFTVVLLMSFARLKYLVLSNVDLDIRGWGRRNMRDLHGAS